MAIIRGEKITQRATLTAAKELHFSEEVTPSSMVASMMASKMEEEFHRGREQGELVGYEKACTENRLFLNLIQTMAQKLLEQKENILNILKPEVVRFAIAICERVIRKELSHPEAMVQLINSLLSYKDQTYGPAPVQVVLAPEDLIMLEEHLSKIEYNVQEMAAIRFRAEPLMKRGDCRIETESGLLNYTIARELANFSSCLGIHC